MRVSRRDVFCFDVLSILVAISSYRKTG